VNDLTKNILVFVVIIVVLLSVVQGLSGVSGVQPQSRDYSDFLNQVRSGQVAVVEIEGEKIRFGSNGTLQYYTISPETDNNTLIGLLDKNDVQFSAAEPKSQSLIGQLLISSFPILLLIGVWIYFMRQMQGGGGGRGAMSFGKSKARLLGEDQVGVTFADVAGVRLLTFSRTRASSSALAARFQRVSSWLARRAPVRHFWREPSPVRRKCRFSRSPVPTLLRCLSVLVRRVFAICLTRRRSRHLALFSSTSWMPLDVIAAPVSVAVMTSASRR
jgi:hypothetical protein